jgi:hypothetical protein
MGRLMPDPRLVAIKAKAEMRERKRENVMRLVEAQIAGCVDLSPEEMVDAAFILVSKIDERLNEDSAPAEVQLR